MSLYSLYLGFDKSWGEVFLSNFCLDRTILVMPSEEEIIAEFPETSERLLKNIKNSWLSIFRNKY